MKDEMRKDLRRWTGIAIDIACLIGVAFLVWTVIQGVETVQEALRQLKAEDNA